MRRTEFIRILDSLDPFPAPSSAEEQVVTPAERAAELLGEAELRGDIAGRTVADLGSGTGVLAIGAALLGAAEVFGVERDATAMLTARRNADRVGVSVRWVEEEVEGFRSPVQTVLMNPPFGAQKRGADRPFWDAAIAVASGAIYAFALADSRTFIERRAVGGGARIESRRAVRWVLPRTFAHHRERRRDLPVDLWVLRVGRT
jgi:putative methylase